MEKKGFGQWGIRVGVLCTLLATMGCEAVRDLREHLRPMTLHETYASALEIAGLEETRLGKNWLETAHAVMRTPVAAAVPLREIGVFSVDEAAAVAYQLELKQGQALHVQATVTSATSGVVFVDLFQVRTDRPGTLRRVASADSSQALALIVERTGEYVLRVQPELLFGGRYEITIEAGASVAFPVAQHDSRAVRSFFGAPRDGGRRRHHGVDIFAPKGTPVVSATDGYVTRVRTGGLGGKVVWVRSDAPTRHYYYAHLDTQIARQGTRVQAGEVIGTVGKTGNARTTPPHLHFGIYRNGPLDPFPFIHEPNEAPQAVAADTSRLGAWLRVTARTTRLRAQPSTRADILDELPRHTAVRVLAGNQGWYRVRLPNGTVGYLTEGATASAAEPFQTTELTAATPLQLAPTPIAIVVDTLDEGATLAATGRFGDYLRVTDAEGRTGWVPTR